MSKIQKFFKNILPSAWARSMEKESREWMMRCGECNFERSIWERGGIRWKAGGSPVRKLTCSECGNFAMHETYKKPAEAKK